jgi:hypothetical protein
LPSTASNPQLPSTTGKVSYPHALLHSKMQGLLFPVAPSAPLPDPISYSDTDSVVHICQNGKWVQSSSVPDRQIYWDSSSFSAYVSHTYRLTGWINEWMNECKRQKEHKMSGRKSKSRVKWSERYFILADGIRAGNTVLGSSNDLPDFPSCINNRKIKNFGMMT